jgi:signal transduction histidine kinase/CheY-like chemotaxis protein
MRMLIDTYQTPGAERLLRLGRKRHGHGAVAPRLLVTEATGAGAFIAVAAGLAAFGSSARSASLGPFAIMVAAYLLAGRVRFPVGSAWTAPTQLVFVPMLFVLPTPLVPATVAACSVAERIPQALREHRAPARLLARVGDSSYALGPALVLVLAHGQTFAWRHWPLYAGALAAQIAFDAGAGLTRTWFAEGVRPSGQLPMLWLYVTDGCLSCIGLLIAATAATRPGLVALALPLVGLMGLLGRERRERLEYSLALSRAYEEARQSNEELHQRATLLARQKLDIELKNEEIELARRGLEEKAAQLALTSKYKSEFLANVSHELRTPLNSILLLARLLAENERGSLSERGLEFAQTIGSAGQDLLALIDVILDLSKVEAGRMELEFAPVGLPDVGASAERAFRPLAQEKGLSFAVETVPSSPATIITDERRLDQILRNLLSNAFKFTHQGGVTLSIGPAGERGAVSFTVRDTGIGIPEDKQKLIFGAFQQADGTTSRRYGGTGLGLSISRELSRLLGGGIGVQSAPGAGSCFSLYLPSAPAASSGACTEPTEPAPAGRGVATLEPAVREGGGDPDPGDGPILVIDAGAEGARVILELVHARGEQAIAVIDPTDALRLVREHRPKAVVAAGGSSQLETVLRELKQRRDTRHIPVIAIGDARTRVAALRLGAAAFVEEPIEYARADVALSHVDALTTSQARRVAVVGGSPDREGVIALLRGIDQVHACAVDPADAGPALRSMPYDLRVVVLGSQGLDEFAFLRELGSDEILLQLPLVVYVPSDLPRGQRARLDALAKTALLALADSPEQLADHLSRFLHRSDATLSSEVHDLLGRVQQDGATLHGKKVLVVDDDIRTGFALTSMLEQCGMKVVYAENGCEGIQRLQQHLNTDLVLLDTMMPDIDGYETAREIRAMTRFAELPIIALSAKAMKGDRDRAIAAGASDHIAKPVDADRLLAMIRAWLGVQ